MSLATGSMWGTWFDTGTFRWKVIKNQVSFVTWERLTIFLGH